MHFLMSFNQESTDLLVCQQSVITKVLKRRLGMNVHQCGNIFFSQISFIVSVLVPILVVQVAFTPLWKRTNKIIISFEMKLINFIIYCCFSTFNSSYIFLFFARSITKEETQSWPPLTKCECVCMSITLNQLQSIPFWNYRWLTKLYHNAKNEIQFVILEILWDKTTIPFIMRIFSYFTIKQLNNKWYMEKSGRKIYCAQNNIIYSRLNAMLSLF